MNPTFIIEMENGQTMKGELYPETAPISVANFVELANSGFYDGVIFHRVIPGFMIQGGESGIKITADIPIMAYGSFHMGIRLHYIKSFRIRPYVFLRKANKFLRRAVFFFVGTP